MLWQHHLSSRFNVRACSVSLCVSWFCQQASVPLCLFVAVKGIFVERPYTQRLGCVGWRDGDYEWRLKMEKVRLRKEKTVRYGEGRDYIKTYMTWHTCIKYLSMPSENTLSNNIRDTSDAHIRYDWHQVSLYTLFHIQLFPACNHQICFLSRLCNTTTYNLKFHS